MKDPDHSEDGTPRFTIDIAIGRGPPRDGETALRTLDPGNFANVPIKKEIFPSVKTEGDCVADVRFNCFSAKALDALRNLRQGASIVFLTPVIIPAGNVEKYNQAPTTDPFEFFGRQVSKKHAPLRHVPYVAGYGFTGDHATFISKAGAVIVVVCEPHGGDRMQSMQDQMRFAQQALKAVQRRDETARSIPVVLVQCGSGERFSGNDVFDTVVESSTFNDDVARRLAEVIFEDPS